MTLADWAQQSQYLVRPGPDGVSRHVPDVATDQQLAIRSQLWNLEDYRVTSVSGGSIWLMPKAAGQ